MSTQITSELRVNHQETRSLIINHERYQNLDDVRKKKLLNSVISQNTMSSNRKALNIVKGLYGKKKDKFDLEKYIDTLQELYVVDPKSFDDIFIDLQKAELESTERVIVDNCYTIYRQDKNSLTCNERGYLRTMWRHYYSPIPQ